MWTHKQCETVLIAATDASAQINQLCEIFMVEGSKFSVGLNILVA